MRPSDPLFVSLDDLVSEGTLTGEQARQLYEAGTRHTADDTIALPGARAGASASASTSASAGSSTGTPGASTGTPDASTGTPDGTPTFGERRGRPDLTQLASAAGIFAAALVAAGFLVTALLASERGFEWKTFVPMVVVTGALAALALVAVLRTGRGTGVLAAVLATLAVLGCGTTVLATWGDMSALVYLAAVLMLAGGLAGFWWLRRDVLTVAAVVGGGLLLSQLLSDLLDFGGDSAIGSVLTMGIVFLVFGIAVVAAGWSFSCRNTTGLMGSIIAVGSMLVVAAVGQTVAVAAAFSVGSFNDGGDGRVRVRQILEDVSRDLRVAMVLGLLASLAVAGLYAYTRRPAYAVVAFIGAALLPLVVVLITAHDHPLRWAAALALVGGLVVTAATARHLVAAASQQSRRPAEPPPPPPPLPSYQP